MQIIREKILRNTLDSNLKITIGSHDDFIGYQQEIDSLTKFTSTDLVNPAIDAEILRFKFNPISEYCIFQFLFNSNLSFINAGFSNSEITGKTVNIQNSFFILDFYDTYKPHSQTKIFTTYLTKVNSTPQYYIGMVPLLGFQTNQFYYWNIPQSYINAQTGSTVTGYVKLSFYNAKSGTTSLFYNQVNSAAPIGLTPEKQYFKAKLNLINNTWEFLNLLNNIVDANELNTSLEYGKRINNTFSKINTVKQNYPTGTTFNGGNATYSVV